MRRQERAYHKSRLKHQTFAIRLASELPDSATTHRKAAFLTTAAPRLIAANRIPTPRRLKWN
jgi:hypothetical protein